MNYQKYKELGNLFKETFQTVVSDKNNLFDFFNQVQMFHKYDIYEQIFIYGQKSNATHIADFDTWKKLGRFVKKGEKSIAVLSQSTGKINIKHYFDFSQTDGKELDFPDYTLEKNDWNLLVSQEIEDLIDEIVDFTEEPDIRRLSIEIGLFLAKNKSIGSEVIDITEQEFTMLQSLPHFFKVMNYANEVNRLISKEILVYKRERMNEHEFKILRERDRTTDTRSRVSQLSTGEIRENSRSQITGRESSRVSNQTSRGRFDEVGTRDQQKSVEQSKRIDRSIGRSQSTDTSSTSEFRGSVEDTNAISGTSNRTRNERDSIDGKSNSDIKDFEEKQSSESFFVEKNPDYEEITPDFTEEELNNILRRGSGVEGGKIRIYHLYQRTLSKKERVSFLKEEYGWSGSTLDIPGSSFSMMDCRPGKGITVIKKINNEDYERVMKWSEVEERIGLLIRQNEYLTEEELKLVQSKKEESVKEELSQMDTEAEELTLFDLEEIETEEKPVVTEGYGTEVAFIPKIEAKKEIINHGETIFEQIYRNKTNGFSFENIDVTQFYPSKEREKIKANLESIRLSKEISQTPGRITTDKERKILAKYVGWGGLAAIFDERDDQYLSERNQLKPLYVVPNHLVGDFGTELLRFYPAKKVLITTKKDFEKSKRKEFVSRIAVGEYDAVIIGHSQFEKITLSPERQKKMLQEEIDRVSEAVAEYQMNNEEESWSIKQMISFEKRLNERLEKLNKQDKKDHMIYFEDLGVDFLFVDEAHVYKNLYSYTKLSNVAGVNASNSLRASDMEMKVKYLLEENNQRGVVFATGTPISNSMSEMFTMQKYLQPDVLEAYGVSHFDAWASTFGEIISSLEINPEGSGYQMKNRFAKFHNLPELMNMFNLVADIQTHGMLKLPVPEVKT